MNSNRLNQDFDPGKDGLGFHSYFAQDVFSYSLEYFHGDYQSVGTTQHLMDKGANNHYLNNFVSLYNGNIGAMITNLTKQDETVNLQAQVFRYDQLNRIKSSLVLKPENENLRAGDNTWDGSEIVGSVIGGSFQNGLATTYTYDPAGNISDLTRTDLTGNLFDNFHYNYEALTINGLGSKNRLFQVTDAVAPSVKTDDFDSQVNADNYVYDLLGRVVEDKAKNLVQTYNKENKIITQTIGSKVVTYKYDFQSKRVSKTVVNAGLTTTEYYVRDPQGNVLAIYADTLQNSRKFTLSELHIYGSSRLGTYKVDSVLWENGTTATSSNKYSFKLGQKRYELSNHLGNVSTIISDRKLVDAQTNGIITAYKADVQSVTDYYPFGKTITERTRSISKTRYDFNGKETDQESGYQDYGFRDYDVEIARFLQVDPLHGKYPWISTYCFAENSPIAYIDLDGLERYPAKFQNHVEMSLLKAGGVYATSIIQMSKNYSFNSLERWAWGLSDSKNTVKGILAEGIIAEEYHDVERGYFTDNKIIEKRGKIYMSSPEEAFGNNVYWDETDSQLEFQVRYVDLFLQVCGDVIDRFQIQYNTFDANGEVTTAWKTFNPSQEGYQHISFKPMYFQIEVKSHAKLTFDDISGHLAQTLKNQNKDELINASFIHWDEDAFKGVNDAKLPNLIKYYETQKVYVRLTKNLSSEAERRRDELQKIITSDPSKDIRKP